MAFKIGDIVQLKSGGPKMTVMSPEKEGGDVFCGWFAGAKRETGFFPPDSLEVAKETEKKTK